MAKRFKERARWRCRPTPDKHWSQVFSLKPTLSRSCKLREPDQEVFIYPANSRRSSPLQEELGYQYFVGRPISPPRELTEILTSPSEDMVSEGLGL